MAGPNRVPLTGTPTRAGDIILYVNSARALSLAGLCGMAVLGMWGCDPEKMVGDPAKPDDKSTTAPAKDHKEEPPKPLKDSPSPGDEVAVLDTDRGRIVFMFYPERAPKTVENFKSLAKRGFYDGTRFHRVLVGFMIQGGDPLSKDLSKADLWGSGGNMDASGQQINVPAEFSEIKHVRGIVSMARGNDPNSASSEFFIVHKDSPHLDLQYSAFGKVVEGMDVVDQIAEKSPVKPPTPRGDGIVFPKYATVVKKVTIQAWPLK